VLLVTTVLLATSLVACQKVTRTVTSQVSPCFKVLPVAHAAVHGQGTFVDVRRIRGTGAVRFPRATTTLVPSPPGPLPGSGGIAPIVPPSPPTTAGPSRDVCVVAYKGTFDPARVDHLIGPNRSGRFAVVIVSVRRAQVRAVILLDRLPTPLHKH
jgi:hypothetical protein